MLHHYLTSRFDMERYWASVKICITRLHHFGRLNVVRHHGPLLRHFGKDTNGRSSASDLKSNTMTGGKARNRQRERERTNSNA